MEVILLGLYTVAGYSLSCGNNPLLFTGLFLFCQAPLTLHPAGAGTEVERRTLGRRHAVSVLG